MAKGKKGKGKPVSKSASSSEVTIDKLLEAASLSKGSDGVVVSPYACTGALRKLANWWDIIIDSFSLSFNGIEIISETTLQLSSGRRYGLIGPNGSGKSTLLNAIGMN
jgi:ATP-binding cassette subfamily F protein 2